MSEPPIEGQEDLTDLVGVEHIAGSMPAAEADLVLARNRFYASLLKDPR